MYIIYKHELNGKSYIGYTKLTIEERLHKHHLNAMAGIDTHFYRAIRKHGIEPIISSVLCECVDFEEAKKKEMEFIEKYDTYKSGYNMTTGGDGGPICKQLSKEGYNRYIKRLSESIKMDKNPNYSGYSDHEVVEHGVKFYKKNGNVWSIRKWYGYASEHGLPKTFSKNRFNGGGVKKFISLIAKELGVEELNKYEKTNEHKQKLAKASSEWRWYTDGVENLRLHKDEKPPSGYKSGRTLKTK